MTGSGMRAGWLGVAASIATAAAALPGGVSAQALVLSASGPSAARFPVGTRLAGGQRLGLSAGDAVLILERGQTRRLTGPLAAYSAMSVNRTTTLGLLAQVAQSSSLKVREQEPRQPRDVRRGATRSGPGPSFDVAAIAAKPYDRIATPLIADPVQDALPLARIVPGERRRLCLLQGEPLFVARHPRDDAQTAVAITVSDATARDRTETITLAPGETYRALPDAWRAARGIRIETARDPGVGAPGAERVGEAYLALLDVSEDDPERRLSLYAGEECVQQTQQLYRVLRGEVGR